MPDGPVFWDDDPQGTIQRLRADLFRVVDEQERLRSALRQANMALHAARKCLTPGMRAGTSEACALLESARAEAVAALSYKARDFPDRT